MKAKLRKHVDDTANVLRQYTSTKGFPFGAIAVHICEPMLERIEELEREVSALHELRQRG